MADLLLRLIGEDAVSGAFDSAGNAAKVAAGIFIDFAKSSAKAFAEGERVQKQLQLAAGKSTDALNEQAEAMKRKFAVDDDAIRQMDVLLLRYGAAPAQIEAATEAVLNYSAVTGKDATQAIETLIRGVESGTGSLGKMGVSFKATGDFGKDLALAVEALGEKFGGAAEADADTLAGRTRAVHLAIDDLKKTFGGMFDEVERRHGVLDKLATSLTKVNEQLQDEGLKVFLGLKTSNLKSREQMERTGGAFGLFDENDPKWQEKLADAQTRDYMAQQRFNELRGKLMASGAWPSEGGQVQEELSKTGLDHKVGSDSARESAAKKAQREAEAYLNTENEWLDKKWLAEVQGQREHDEEMLEMKRARSQLEMKIAQDEFDAETEIINMQAQRRIDEEKQYQQDLKTQGELLVKHFNDQELQLKQRKKMWANAGMQIGQALINGIFQALEGLTASGENDKDRDRRAIKITQGIFNAVFSAFGMGWMSQMGFGAIGAGEAGGTEGFAASFGGSMAAYGAQYGAQAGFSATNAPSSHSGGWIQKFHGGGWLRDDEQMLIGQTGERMLSRREVAGMGGPAGVEAAVRGGGGGTVVIQAFDHTNLLEFMGVRGGRAMVNGQRANIGNLRQAFGKAG